MNHKLPLPCQTKFRKYQEIEVSEQALRETGRPLPPDPSTTHDSRGVAEDQASPCPSWADTLNPGERETPWIFPFLSGIFIGAVISAVATSLWLAFWSHLS